MIESITARIQHAGEKLGVSRGELAEEVARFADEDDEQGLVGMFDAYFNWENSGTPHETSEETRVRCLENFHLIAQMADSARIAGDMELGLVTVWNNDRTIAGHSTVFFKDVLEYEPPAEAPKL